MSSGVKTFEEGGKTYYFRNGKKFFFKTCQNRMVVEAYYHHNKRIIANEYVKYNPVTDQHEVIDNINLAQHIKTISTITTTQYTRDEDVNMRGYVSVLYTCYDVTTEPTGERLYTEAGDCTNVSYWFIIEPEPSSTSTAGGSNLKYNGSLKF